MHEDLSSIPLEPILMMYIELIFSISSLYLVHALTDYTLSCQRGYKISAIQRSNSIFQNGRAGSLAIECQSILETDLDSVIFTLFYMLIFNI